MFNNRLSITLIAMLFAIGCSSSKEANKGGGGTEKDNNNNSSTNCQQTGGNNQQPATGYGPTGSQSNTQNGGYGLNNNYGSSSNSTSRDCQSSNVSQRNNQIANEAQTSSDTSDQGVCAFMQNFNAVQQNFGKELNYLCGQGGMQQLRQSQPVANLLNDTQQPNSQYTIIMYGKYPVSLNAMNALGNLFCENNAEYQAVAPQAFTNIDRLTVSGVQPGKGCQYHFKGKTKVFFTPEFQGLVNFLKDTNSQISVKIDYLTRPLGDNLVKDSKELSVTVQKDGFIENFAVRFVSVDTKGFHETTRDELLQGISAYRSVMIRKLQELDQRAGGASALAHSHGY